MKGFVCCVVAFFTFVVAHLSGQTSQGRILGTVTDSSGAVVSSARVTITNTATGISRVIQTNTVGRSASPCGQDVARRTAARQRFAPSPRSAK